MSVAKPAWCMAEDILSCCVCVLARCFHRSDILGWGELESTALTKIMRKGDCARQISVLFIPLARNRLDRDTTLFFPFYEFRDFGGKKKNPMWIDAELSWMGLLLLWMWRRSIWKAADFTLCPCRALITCLQIFIPNGTANSSHFIKLFLSADPRPSGVLTLNCLLKCLRGKASEKLI